MADIITLGQVRVPLVSIHKIKLTLTVYYITNFVMIFETDIWKKGTALNKYIDLLLIFFFYFKLPWFLKQLSQGKVLLSFSLSHCSCVINKIGNKYNFRTAE